MRTHWLTVGSALAVVAFGTARPAAAQGFGQAPLVPTTGHPAGFMIQGSYFQTVNGGPVRPAAATGADRPGLLTSPAVSPYINLLRAGSDPAVNYYGLVRPFVDQQGYNQQFLDRQWQIQTELEQKVPLPQTGAVPLPGTTPLPPR